MKLLGLQKHRAEETYRLMHFVVQTEVDDGLLLLHNMTKEMVLLSKEEQRVFEQCPTDLPELIDRWFQLPTEAQWHYAALGGQKSNGYVYAGSDNLDKVAWNAANTNKANGVAMRWPNELGIYDMTGNYWGAKKACEPIHIQWNCYNNDISIVNTTLETVKGYRAKIEVYDLNGLKNNDISGGVEDITSAPNSVVNIYNLNTSGKKKLSTMQGMFLLKLSLFDDEGEMVSENTYWKTTLGSTRDDYRKLNDIPQADVSSEFSIVEADGTTIRATATLKNHSNTPAFAIRLRLVDDKNQRILPVIMDDNYITLLPGESKTIDMEFENQNIAGNTHLLIKQYNYDEAERGVANDIIEIQSDHAVDGLAHIYKIDGTLCRVLEKQFFLSFWLLASLLSMPSKLPHLSRVTVFVS